MRSLAPAVALSLLAAPLLAQHLTVTTLAGVPGAAGANDGFRFAATFNRPTWIDVDARDGTVYVVDRANDALRRIRFGQVSTVRVHTNEYDPSSAIVPFSFGGPLGGGIAVEATNAGCGGSAYADGILVARTGTKDVALIVDQPIPAFAKRDEGAAVFAGFDSPSGIAVTKPFVRDIRVTINAVFVADAGDDTIRRAQYGFGAEGCPILDTRVPVFAGTAHVAGWADGTGSAARFNAPRGLAIAPDNSLYVADSGNHVIRHITTAGVVTTVAGTPGERGSDATHLDTPSGVAVNAAGEVFIADTGNHVIRKLANGILETIAGTPGAAGFADGDALHAQFNGPVGITVDRDGALLVADTSNNVIRRIAITSSPERARVVHK